MPKKVYNCQMYVYEKNDKKLEVKSLFMDAKAKENQLKNLLILSLLFRPYFYSIYMNFISELRFAITQFRMSLLCTTDSTLTESLVRLTTFSHSRIHLSWYGDAVCRLSSLSMYMTEMCIILKNELFPQILIFLLVFFQNAINKMCWDFHFNVFDLFDYYTHCSIPLAATAVGVVFVIVIVIRSFIFRFKWNHMFIFRHLQTSGFYMTESAIAKLYFS